MTLFPSMMRLPEFDVFLPENPEEAVKIFYRVKGSEFIAGGTNLIPEIKRRNVKVSALIDLSGLSKLRYIKVDKKNVRVGALVTLSQFLSNRSVRKIPAFKTMREKASSPAAMNLATVGGAVSLKSRESDLYVILLSLGGRVKILGRRGEKILGIDEFSERRLRGLITEVSLPLPSPRTLTLFDKLNFTTSRYSIASVALTIKVDGKGRIRDVRVAGNCVKGGKPGRIRKVEESLKNRILESSLIREVGEEFVDAVNPHSDPIASAWYRKRVLSILFRRLGLKAAKILRRRLMK